MTEPPQPEPQQPWQPPQPPQPVPPQFGYPQGYTPEPPTTSKATIALVLGIVGLTVCPGAASIPAWIIGHDAVKEIDASNGTLGGRSVALAGKVTGIIGTALAALGVLVLGAFLLIGAVFVSSVDDCTATGDDTSFSVDC